MLGGQKILKKFFARCSPVFAACGMAVAGMCVCVPVGFAHGADASTKTGSNTVAKREAAATQFARAEEQRSVLNQKQPDKRKLADYKQVIASYKRVYLITPRAAEVGDSLLAVGELYSEMGDRFGRTYYQSAIDSYQFLLKEYPGTKYGQDVMLRIGKLQRDQLADSAQASKTYEEFLKKYPHSQRKREAQEALAELALLQHADAPPAAADTTTAPVAPSAPTAESARRDERATTDLVSGPVRGGVEAVRRNWQGAPRIRRITTSANADATRVTIDLEETVQYSSGHIVNPERIFFDLHSARLPPEVARANIQVVGNLLTAIRVAQNQAGVVRVVLDVNGVRDYTASLASNPPQLVIFLYSDLRHGALTKTAKANKGNGGTGAMDAVEAARAPADDAGDVKAVAAKEPEPVDSRLTPTANATRSAAAAKKSHSKDLTGSNAKPDLPQPATLPQPLRDGNSTLTRALGLKIGRIVIDPGHGGHDTGTIGPTGLMEKDLCLDVALRLGKIIQQRLPGADIVYTRSDDTFIPLEERTNIANQAKADLFISIHANSSHDHEARGIETYYLNLKGTPEAMEVAARENAASDQGVHDLQDLVKKITQTEKIDESREFAADIQDSLAKRMMRASRNMKNRGVRKAPFVVLIGADMPSILTEISFLSNPADEKLLKQPEYRQKVAEGLYQGVASYLQSLNSMTLNLPTKNGPARTAAAPPVEQSRNQR